MTDWSLIGVRFVVYLSLAGLFGLSAFSLYALRGSERGTALALRPWLIGSAASGLLWSAAWVVLTAASMAGTSVWPVDHAAVGALLDQPGIGTAWKVRMVGLTLAGIAAGFGPARSLWLASVMLSSAIALATLAWTGHGAGSEGSIGWVHLVADIFHLLAAGMWAGALLGLILLVARPARHVDAPHLMLTHRALHGFATVGTSIVATIVVTGLVNAWLLVGIGNVLDLGATLYGRLLIAKLILLAATLGLASLNRFWLTPTFERSIAGGDHASTLRALRRSLSVETACIVFILVLVAWLGTLEPPTSAM